MKKIRIMLDYRAYPIWLYDEIGDLIDTVLPDELKGCAKIEQLCDDIQVTYEGLFTDNKIEFSYNGFSNRDEEDVFIKKLKHLVDTVTEKLGGKYHIVNDIDAQWKS